MLQATFPQINERTCLLASDRESMTTAMMMRILVALQKNLNVPSSAAEKCENFEAKHRYVWMLMIREFKFT
jgi:hypothetical protein